MELNKKIIIFIDNYKITNCSHLKGYLNYQLIKKKYKNVLLLSCNNIKIINNKLSIYFYDDKKRMNKKNLEQKLIILKNNIILFIKQIPNLEILHFLKKNNNILIHEIIDFMNKYNKGNYQNYFKNLQYDNKFLFNKIIVNSNHLKNLYNEYYNNIEVIYHHYDTKIKPNSNIKPNILYLGNPKKYSFKNLEEYNIKIMKKKENVNYLNNSYPCIHVCFVFNNDKLNNFYTSTKLATAIRSNSIFVCSKIPIFIELLGKDYEFYCNTENDILNVLEKAKITLLDNDKYTEYLKKYKYLNDKLNINNLVNDYYKIFDNLI